MWGSCDFGRWVLKLVLLLYFSVISIILVRLCLVRLSLVFSMVVLNFFIGVVLMLCIFVVSSSVFIVR